MTSKQRAYLKSKASVMDPIFQIGKSSVTTENIEAINEALEKRELIKLHVLKNSYQTNISKVPLKIDMNYWRGLLILMGVYLRQKHIMNFV